MGLLSKTPDMEPSASNFPQWAELNGFEHCGVFCYTRSLMLMQYAYGVDAMSVLCSISTKDFWNGSVQTDGWLELDRENPEFLAFVQFFGKETRDKVESIRILKLPAETQMVLFVYDFKPLPPAPESKATADSLIEILKLHNTNLIETPLQESISGLVGNRPARLCYVSLRSALEETVAHVEISELTIQNILLNTIFDELFYITKRLFAWPDFIFSENRKEIKIAAIISDDIEEELLKEHLVSEYKEILDVSIAKKISVLNAGYSSNSAEILDYLLRG